jgi:hypothetical protein
VLAELVFLATLYKIYINNADDNIRVYVNGVQIHDGGIINTTTQIGAAAGYVLSSTDQVEIRLMDYCSSGLANVSFVAQTVPSLTEATIGSNQTYCGTATPASISGVAATGGYGNAYTVWLVHLRLEVFRWMCATSCICWIQTVHH